MKTILFLTFAFLGFNAQAEDILQTQISKITNIENSPFAGATGGVIQLNNEESTIQLILDFPEGQRVFNLPIVRKLDGFCNSEILIAEKDRSPSDGPREEIVLKNFALSSCQVEPLQTIELVLSTEIIDRRGSQKTLTQISAGSFE